jgi:hypothetical protein
VLQVLTAIKPSASSAPTTTIVDNTVVISWTPPSLNSLVDYGAVITSYKILIEHSGSGFDLELSYCNGNDPIIVANTKCTIPLDVVMAYPFDLVLTDHVVAKIITTNIQGDSPESPTGNGAVVYISVPPDPPKNLLRVDALTDSTKVTFTWADGDFNGGQIV